MMCLFPVKTDVGEFNLVFLNLDVSFAFLADLINHLECHSYVQSCMLKYNGIDDIFINTLVFWIYVSSVLDLMDRVTKYVLWELRQAFCWK